MNKEYMHHEMCCFLLFRSVMKTTRSDLVSDLTIVLDFSPVNTIVFLNGCKF
jgi:hypothetical protein